MSDKKWGFFPFDAMDYKAAQDYLDKKSELGWILDKLYLKRFARFIPAEDRYHCVDIDAPHVFEDDLDWNYVEFCEEAGWELVTSVRSMLIFRSKSGLHPTLLQTDESMEAERFWKRHMRKNLIWTLVLLLVLLPLCFVLTLRGTDAVVFSEFLSFNSSLLLPPLFLILAVCLIRDLVCMIKVAVCFHHSGAMPKQTRSGAWVFGLLAFLALLLWMIWWGTHFAEGFGLGETVDVALDPFGNETSATSELCQSYPVITAADLGLEYSEDSRYLDGRRSALVDFLDYSEIADGEMGATHILTTERYECISETLAEWLFASRRSETAHRHGFTWGELEWGETASEYGFDQVCFARDNSYLLLQEGSTVALVGATEFDLTEYLDTIRERLELEA